MLLGTDQVSRQNIHANCSDIEIIFSQITELNAGVENVKAEQKRSINKYITIIQ